MKRNISNIKFIGYQNEIFPFLSGSDVLVLTSFIEGVPGIILEAAAQKTPAIAINKGGVSEAIINNETGIVIDTYSASEFSNKIITLLENKNKYELFSKNCYEFVVANYNETQKTTEFENNNKIPKVVGYLDIYKDGDDITNLLI